ncbi:hypothetical protein EBI_25462 [Enterocytozoon bieneusi H348]|nr:hypothetical protein EBI_25462 [Enterocytozoon bieneusi H348]|eukprot:XP_002650919.1 hypothetical protein EBI_25462 [Enterocytozoon bieneusi H348]
MLLHLPGIPEKLFSFCNAKKNFKTPRENKIPKKISSFTPPQFF